jgi:hypothetical protein
MRSKPLKKLAAALLTTSLGVGWLSAGNLDQLMYIGVTGNRVNDLYTSPNNLTFPNNPWNVNPYIELMSPGTPVPPPAFIETLGEISNIGSAMFIRGNLEPPQTGSSPGWVTGHEDAQFRLSSDTSSANAVVEAFTDGFTGINDWARRLSQKSRRIHLVKGQQYYFELIQKSGGAGGGDAQLGWWLPDFTLERPVPIRYAQRFPWAAICTGPGSCDGNFIPEGNFPTPRFDRSPGNNASNPPINNSVTIVENNPYDLSPWITVQHPVTYQWQEMQGYLPPGSGSPGTPVNLVDEITSAKYIPKVTTAQHNQKAYRIQVTKGGTTTSSAVTYISVIPDGTRPSIVSANAAGNTNGFNVTFSENIDPVTATDKANYSVNNGVVIDRVELRYGDDPNNTVVVYTTGAIPGNSIVTVNNVRDIAANPNTILANTTADILLTDGIISFFAYGAINGGAAIGGTAISDMLSQTNRFSLPSIDQANRIPPVGVPDQATNRPELGIPANVGNNYGVSLIGFLFPPATGRYNIVIAGDDQSIVYISPNADPTAKVAQAVEPQWDGFRQYIDNERRTMGQTGNSTFISGNFVGAAVSQQNANIRANQSKNTVNGTQLVRGNKHYIEVLMKEGGGGDNVDVTWQLPGTYDPVHSSNGGSVPLVNNQAPIPGVYLSLFATAGQSGPISITQDPASVTILENRPVTFSVVHGGSPSFSYQWYQGDVIIPDANAREFTLLLPDPEDDDGTELNVRVRNLFSDALSAKATLTVTPDTEGPELVRAVGSASYDTVTIWFNEVIDPATATDPANYRIVATGTTTELQIFSSTGTLTEQGPGGYTRVVFQTGPQTEGQNYTITVNDVRDIPNAGNEIAADSTVSFTGWVASKGFVLYERWWDINGGNVNTVKADPRYPGNPSVSSYRTLWESLEGIAEQFGARLSGYFYAAGGAGRYDFFMASDDNGELWIANDSNSTMANVRLGFEPQWGNRRSWTGTSDGRRAEGDNNTLGDNQSALNFQAGERRYMELIYKEGGGGDYGDATFRIPGAGVPANGSSSTLVGPYIGTIANPDETTFTYTTQPPDAATRSENTTLQLTAAGSGQTLDDKLQTPPTSSAVFWQWQRQAPATSTWTDIPGANGTTYTTPLLTPSDDQASYRVVASIPGLSSPSTATLLTIEPDVEAPTVTGVSANPSNGGGTFGVQNTVRVFFSEVMNRGSIQSIGNYSILSGGNPLGITSAVAASDDRSVTLTVSPALVSGQQYTISVEGTIDPSVAAHVITPNPTVRQFTGWTLANTVRRQLYFNIGGGSLNNLTNNAAFPNSPNVDDYVQLFEEPPSDFNGRGPNRENFGTRLTGLIVPTETANYHFAISGDDNQAFYLSTDATPATRRLIVAEPQWNGYRAYNTNDRRVGGNNFFPGVTTLPINRSQNTVGATPLVADTQYYAELLAKEGGGGDSTAIVWWKEGENMPADNTPAIAASFVRSYVNPDNTINISAQPQDQTVAPAANATFSVTAAPTAPFLGGPITYQWRRGGANINGATGASYTLNGVTAGDDGATFDVVMNAPGAPSVTSAVATLDVQSVITEPTLTITKNGNNVTVSYLDADRAAGHVLQTADTLTTPNTFADETITGATVGLNFETVKDVTAGDDQSYWRTRHP